MQSPTILPTDSPTIESIQIQTPSRDFLDFFPQTPISNISPIRPFAVNQLLSPLSNTVLQPISPNRINDSFSTIALPNIDFIFSPQSSSQNQSAIPSIPEFSENAQFNLPPLPELPTIYTSEDLPIPCIKKEISISPANVLDPNGSNTKTNS